MPRSRPLKRSALSASVLLVAAGALAGVALGMLLADRVGGVDGLLRRGSGTGSRRVRTDGWRGDDRRSEAFDTLADDESELAPESIAHMHVSDRASLQERAVLESLRASNALAARDRAPLPRSRPTAPDHETLEARVLEVFRNDPVLSVRPIDIGALRAGTIELTGWVRSPQEAAHALTLARGVPDVASVIDRLSVRGTGGGLRTGLDGDAAPMAPRRTD